MHSISSKSATTLQSIFRGRQARLEEKTDLINKSIKLKILDHMKQIKNCINNSDSANSQNTRTVTVVDGIPCDILDRHEKKSQSSTPLNDEEYIISTIARDLTQLFPLKEKTEIMTHALNLFYQKKDMTCDMLAVYTATILKNDSTLPKEIRTQIHICKCENHTFVCIGNPEDESTLIVDPWINYLILTPTFGYRNTHSDFSMRDRGFFGTVKEFKEFLKFHPNKYISNYGADMDFESDANLTELTNHLRLDQIHSSQSAEGMFDFFERIVLSIQDKQTLVEVLNKALSCDADENVLNIFFKHPLISNLELKDVIKNNDLSIFNLFIKLKIKTPIQLMDAMFSHKIPRCYIYEHPFLSVENFIENNNLEYIDYAIKNDIISLISTNEQKNHFLQLCALTNKPEIMRMIFLNIEQYLYSYFVQNISTLLLDCQNNKMETLLHICVKNMDPEFIEDTLIPFLIDHNSNFNVQDGFGNTPLHTAILSLQVETACSIANLVNVDFEIRNRDGLRPIDLATKIGIENPKLFELMLSQ